MANKKLSATITIGGTISSTLKSAFGTTTTQIRNIGKEIGELGKRQKVLGGVIGDFTRMGKNVDGMRSSYSRLGAEIDRLRRSQERLNAVQRRSDNMKLFAGRAAVVGAGATATGAVMGAPIIKSMREARSYETEMGRIAALGMGEKINKDAAAFAMGMKTYGTSKLENLTLVRDALSVFGDLHHAKMAAPILAQMKFGNAAFFGSEHGAENEAAFMNLLKVVELRGGSSNESAFKKHSNMVQKVISATGGRVGANEWQNLISTGGTAAKLMRDDAFYYQLEPLVQMMGGDKVGTGLSAAYSSLYQGRTTKRAAINLEKYGFIADKSKVKHDKVGQVSQLNPGALLGSDLFRQSQFEWVKQVLIPTLAKRGVTDDKEIVDIIGSLVSNKKGADMLAAMVMQRSLIDKDERRNRGAYDIDQLDAAGRGTTGGKQISAEKKLEDLKLEVGKKVLPLYTSALESAGSALDKLNSFVEKNPTLTKYMAVGLAGIAGAVVTLGPILIAGGGLVTAYAAYQMRAAAASASAARGIAAETAAIKTQNSALGGGIGALLKRFAIITAIANVADYAVGKLGVGKELPDEDQDQKNWDRMNTFSKVWSSVPRGIEGVGRFIGMTNISNQAQTDRIKNETAFLDGIAPARGGGTVVNDHSTTTIQLTQQPGESQDAMVDRLMEQMSKFKGAQYRSTMMDGGGKQ